MMHHENINCGRCKKQLGIAVTTTMASSAKMVAWLECDNCEHLNKVEWSSNPNMGTDLSQMNLFEGPKNL